MIGLCKQPPFPNMQDRAYREKIAKRAAEAASLRKKLDILPTQSIAHASVPVSPAPSDRHSEGSSSGAGGVQAISQPVKKNARQSAMERQLPKPDALPKANASAKKRPRKKTS